MPLIQLCSVVSISFVQLENVCCWQLGKGIYHHEWLRWRGGEGHKELVSGTGVQHFNPCISINKSRNPAYQGKSLLSYKWCGLTVAEFSSAIICPKKPIYKWAGDCKMNPWEHFFQRGGYWQGCIAERMDYEQNYLSQDNSLQGQTLTLHQWGKRGSGCAIEEELFEGGTGPDQLPLEDCKQLLLLPERVSYQPFGGLTLMCQSQDFPISCLCTFCSRPQEKPTLNFFYEEKGLHLIPRINHLEQFQYESPE